MSATSSPRRSRPSFSAFVAYHFENLIARGPGAIIVMLFLLVLVIVLVGAAVIVGFGLSASDQPMDFGEAAWNSLMHQVDSGMVTADNGWAFRLVAFLVTLGGIFVFSTFIGVLNTALQDKLDNLRKGRSKVLEEGHTLILGWSPKVFTIISELVIANGSERKPRIVILAPKDKVEMEDSIRERISNFGTTKVICRSGSPIDPADRDLVNPNGAKSIIILAPEEENPDIHVIKAILALTNNPQRRSEPFHIVAELNDPAYREAASLVGGDEVSFIEGRDLIARLTAQTCRQSGLSIVYTELLDFGGSEIYFKEEPGLVGKTFHDLLFAYPSSCPIGLMLAGGQIRLAPAMATVLATGDQIIAVAEDDSTFRMDSTAKVQFDAEAMVSKPGRKAMSEANLILGWNEKLPIIAAELDSYLAPGSKLVIMADRPTESLRDEIASLKLKNQTVSYVMGDITHRDDLEALGLNNFDDIIVLGDSALPVQEADARTLIALLHLRRYTDQSGRDLNIVSEMFDVRNRDLAEVAKADDFIVSDRLVSLMLAQLSENRRLRGVFDELFTSDGAEIYLRPIDEYVLPGRELDFATLVEAASRKGQVAIGFRRVALSHEPDQGYGVVVNPPKSQRIKFTPEDQVVLIAETEDA